MTLRTKPLRGGGNAIIDYRDFLRDVLAGRRPAVALTDSRTATGQSTTVDVDAYLQDPTGTFNIDGVLHRRERRTVSVPVFRLISMAYDDGVAAAGRVKRT